MMWSYLTNSNSELSNILTFEQIVDIHDFEEIKKGYCKLIVENFFDSFSSHYDTIFISSYDPNSKPLYKTKLFSMKFDDKNNANIEYNSLKIDKKSN